MAHPVGESESDIPGLNFDRRIKLELNGLVSQLTLV